jgi:NAD(P)H-dependent FMN reductase
MSRLPTGPEPDLRGLRLLAISGSLRAASSNGALVGAVALVAPPGVTVETYDGLSALPHFNPDADVEPAPPAVAAWRERLAAADGVLLSSPEYAHGVPGALKNALDWIVGSGEFMLKPVALVNASPMSHFAHPQLAETLAVMMAAIVPEASVVIPLAGRGLDAAGVAADPALGPALGDAVAALARAAAAARTARDAA